MTNGADTARRSEVNAILKAGPDAINEFLVTSVMNLNENGCAVGRKHEDDIEYLRRHRDSGNNEKKFAGLSYGKWKFGVIPAVIISTFIGIAILQYSHTEKLAAIAKEEARVEAANVAKVELRREIRSIDRDDFAIFMQEKLAQAVQTYMERNGK